MAKTKRVLTSSQEAKKKEKATLQRREAATRANYWRAKEREIKSLFKKLRALLDRDEKSLMAALKQQKLASQRRSGPTTKIAV